MGKTPSLILIGILLIATAAPGFGAAPPDPLTDVDWSCPTSSVSDIECAFNAARTHENTELGLSLPNVDLPSQSEWDALSDGEKALWLINVERVDRGVDPLHDTEFNVESVARTYADYLLANDAWGHYEDGNSPSGRMGANPTIAACRDSLPVSENLAVFVSGGMIPLPVERSVYNWLYDDAGSSWGHRYAILYYPYNDNGGESGKEGFLGIGRASGGPYQGPFSSQWPNAELIVMNVFDPCSTWDYSYTPTAVTGSASDIEPAFDCASASATFAGTVNPNGGATNYYFEYWPDGGATSSTSVQDAGSGNSDMDVTVTVDGLDPGTTYYFRVVADNGSSVVEGDSVSFETPSSSFAYIADSGGCGGLTPCDSLVQSGLESIAAGASCIALYVEQGDYLEDYDTASGKNIILDADVSVVIGYDASDPFYTNYSSSPTTIRAGDPTSPTITVQDGSVTFWNVVLP